jgi:4,5-DOPA dioxygenase extradiol
LDRRKFIGLSAMSLAFASLSSIKPLFNDQIRRDELLPTLFVGHGSPMNAVEQNEFTKKWEKLARNFDTPKAIICISAHWLTKGTFVTSMEQPKTIHDFGGFPQALFDVQYPAPGSVDVAHWTKEVIQSTNVHDDHEWGLDHGTWSVLKNMYPDASIPVLQLSIDYSKPLSYHFQLAQELKALRKKGVLIMGSGNMVHNLGMVAWDKLNTPGFGFDWALEIDALFKLKIENRDYQSLINWTDLHKQISLAVPTLDHYIPLIYSVGLSEKDDEISFFNDKAVAGSLTMTSVQFGV